MTATMMVKVKMISRLLSLLYLYVFAVSCDTKKSNKELTETPVKARDLEIAVTLPAHKAVQLNYVDENLLVQSLIFDNKQIKDTIITHKIMISGDTQILSYLGFLFDNGVLKEFHHDYLLDTTTAKMSFKYLDNGDLAADDGGKLEIDYITEPYKKNMGTDLERKANPQKIKKDIDSVYCALTDQKHSKQIQEVNRLLYVQTLATLDASKYRTEIADYLFTIRNPIYSLMLRDVLVAFNQADYNNCDFKLSQSATSPQYKVLYIKGVFNKLIEIRNKDKDCFNKGYVLLKSTDYYKQNRSVIDSHLHSLNKQEFASRFAQLDLYDVEGKSLKMSQLIKQANARLYIIDFWATWCGPCIKEYEVLRKLELPADISIINLSVDKISNVENWKAKAKKLNHKYSGLVDETKSNFEFIQMIELNDIPRYIVIDSKFNLISYEFSKPTDQNYIKNLSALLSQAEFKDN